MSTKNLVINNELGSFTFNEASLEALKEYLVYSLPIVNRHIEETLDGFNFDSPQGVISKQDDLECSYVKHIDSVVRPLVRNISAILNPSV